MTEFRPGGFQQLPFVVKNLIIINVLVFFLRYVLETKGIILDDYLGLHYWHSPLFHWWQLITHMFMHGSIAHIFFNMFALWMFGRILENIWGPRRFFIFYMVCGLGAALCHLGVLTYEFAPFDHALAQYQLNPNVEDFVRIANKYPLMGVDIDKVNKLLISEWRMDPANAEYATQSVALLKTHLNEATIGASGAVFGLLFAFGYLFPNAELFLLFPPIPLKAKWFVAIYALIELVSGIQNSAGDNVAHFAHLGGMLFAFILLRIWRKTIRNSFY